MGFSIRVLSLLALFACVTAIGWAYRIGVAKRTTGTGEQTFYSNNTAQSLAVIPRCLPWAYGSCLGVLYTRTSQGNYRESRRFELINENAPFLVLISDDGRYIVSVGEYPQGDPFFDVGSRERLAAVVYDEMGHAIQKIPADSVLREDETLVTNERSDTLREARAQYDRCPWMDWERMQLVLTTIGRNFIKMGADSLMIRHCESRVDILSGQWAPRREELLGPYRHGPVRVITLE